MDHGFSVNKCFQECVFLRACAGGWVGLRGGGGGNGASS